MVGMISSAINHSVIVGVGFLKASSATDDLILFVMLSHADAPKISSLLEGRLWSAKNTVNFPIPTKSQEMY